MKNVLVAIHTLGMAVEAEAEAEADEEDGSSEHASTTAAPGNGYGPKPSERPNRYCNDCVRTTVRIPPMDTKIQHSLPVVIPRSNSVTIMEFGKNRRIPLNSSVMVVVVDDISTVSPVNSSKCVWIAGI